MCNWHQLEKLKQHNQQKEVSQIKAAPPRARFNLPLAGAQVKEWRPWWILQPEMVGSLVSRSLTLPFCHYKTNNFF